MVGCDGAYTKNDFRSACASGWHVATATDYHKYGGSIVVPSSPRWVDVAWDAQGREMSLDDWQGFFPISNNIDRWYEDDFTANPMRQDDSCIWLSINEQCKLTFANHDRYGLRSNTYGTSYGCHCRGDGINGTYGVICVKDYEGKNHLV